MFRKMPFVLLGMILCILLLNGIMPFALKSFLYALSLSIKSVIIFVLPLIIFLLLFKTMAQLANKATKVIFLILAGVCVSNFLSTMISYQVGSAIYQLDLSIAPPKDHTALFPLWTLSLPKLIANDHAMFSGLILGILFSLFRPKVAAKVAGYFEKIVNVLLRAILYVIPFFIAGFIVKLIDDKIMESIVGDYALIFLLVALAQFGYVALIYLVSSRFHIREFFSKIKNMLPAAIAGFGSMSSAAAMPLTIVGTEKNIKNPELARLVIPTTVNTHLIGDCFAIPIFAFAVMKNFGVVEPAFYSYLMFAIYFVMAKFSVAAIPGGGIIVMLPILESQLGFTAEMSSLITALYILFDPVITCANVCGNGGFAMGINKLETVFFKKKSGPIAMET